MVNDAPTKIEEAPASAVEPVAKSEPSLLARLPREDVSAQVEKVIEDVKATGAIFVKHGLSTIKQGMSRLEEFLGALDGDEPPKKKS